MFGMFDVEQWISTRGIEALHRPKRCVLTGKGRVQKATWLPTAASQGWSVLTGQEFFD